jgi:glycosyltransferase involved in cell wall biosynthesis
VAAYVGRRTAFKGFDIAVRGFLEAGIDHSAMLIVGAPDRTHAHGLSAAECDALTSDRRFVDVGWQNDVAPVLAVADVCLLPSTREGMPVTAMEALSIGVPVITVDARGCRDVVRDGVDGVVLPEARTDSVASVLRGLAADRPRLAAMAAAAIVGRGRFDRSLYVADEIAFYAREVAGLRDRADHGARVTL